MQPLRSQESPSELTLVEVVLVDDDPEPAVEIQATDRVVVRFSAGVAPELAAAVVEAVCAC